jgi:ligand-binding sensor domain-containing protein
MKQFINYCKISVFFAAVPAAIFAQPDQDTFNTWQSYYNMGTFMDNPVHAIAVDGKGAIWVGSLNAGGLCKYENEVWTCYSVNGDSLKNTITCIAIDTLDHVWFGTEGAGLCKFDGKNWTWYTVADGLRDNRVTAVAVDRQNNKWFGTLLGLCKYDGLNWTNYTFDFDLDVANFPIQSIAVNDQNDIWIGNSYCVSRFSQGIWTHFTKVNEKILSGHCFAFDQEGNTWVVMGEEIAKYDGNNWSFFRNDDPGDIGYYYCIAVDGSGTKWIGANPHLYSFNDTVWTGDIINDSPVYSIAIDKSGYKWIGNNIGIASDYYNLNNFSLPPNIYHNVIRSIKMEDNGTLWCGTNGGLSKFDATHWVTYILRENKNNSFHNRVQSIDFDENGNIWMGTNRGGVYKFDGVNWTNYNTTSGLAYKDVRSIDVLNKNNIWAGTLDGVSHFDGENWITFKTTDGLINNAVLSLAVEQNGDIWCGTDAGISRFDGLKWESFDTVEDVAIPEIISNISFDKEGNKYFGTWGSGALKYNGNEWTRYDTSDGLVSDYILATAVDSTGVIWFGGYLGVDASYDTTWITYTMEEGLADSMVWSMYVDADNNKWFGTNNGLTGYGKNLPTVSLMLQAKVLSKVLCSGGTDGQASVTVLQGTPPFEYLWDDDDATTFSAVSGLKANRWYHVRVSDAGGQTATDSIYLTEPPALEISIDTVIAPCYQNADGSIVAGISGGTAPYTYAWNTNDTSLALSDIQAGVYTLSVSDINNCVANQTDTVREMPEIITGNIYGETTVNENEIYSYTVNGNLGSEFEWTIQGGTIMSGQGTDNITAHWTDEINGTLSVTETKGRCSGDPVSVNVTVLSSATDTQADNGLKVYTIPSSQKAILEFSNPKGEKYQLMVTNLSGQIIKIEKSILTDHYEMNMEGIPAGIYLIELSGDRFYRTKVILTRER